MGTRGLYGFRKNGVDKTTYNHFDSYPEWLGRSVVEFCRHTSEEEMCEMYDRIEMVGARSKPTKKQIDFCINHGLFDDNVSTRSETDWYCLLRNIQGSLDDLRHVIKSSGKAYLIDNHSFILDSLWCEYAYIINLDTHMLEFYVGYQKEPQDGNRYGRKVTDGYYPCRLAAEIPLSELQDVDSIVQRMNAA